MKAAILEELGKPLVIKDVPTPKPAEDQVLIKVKAVGVCYSDIHIADGDIPPPKLPLILGHEVAGIVEELGLKVKERSRIKVGSRVALSWLYWTCGMCEFCINGYENLCDNQLNTGYSINGGYAEYIAAYPEFLIPIPDNVTFEAATSATDAVATPYRAFKKIKLKPRQLVAVFGVGGLGHNAIQLAKLFGARVVAVDVKLQKLSFAKELGADYIVNAIEEDPVKFVKEMGGADVAVCPISGNESKPIEQAYASLRKLGILVPIALPVKPMSIPVIDINLTEKTVIGTLGFTRNDIKESMKLVAEGLIKPRYEKFHLEDINEVHRKLKRGEILGRAILAF